MTITNFVRDKGFFSLIILYGVHSMKPRVESERTCETTDQQVDHKRGRNITNLERS